MTPHLSEASLILLLDGELAEDERALAESHVSGCAGCHARMARFRRVSAGIVALHHAPRPARRPARWWWLAPAAAAALALVWQWRPVAPPPAMEMPRVVLRTPPAPLPGEPAALVRAVNKVAPRPAPPRPFIDLPFSDQSLPLDAAPIVRMSIPVESLRLASIRVNGHFQGERVLADVVLGLDGQPRAIRFVP
jgi:hypothetical protein